MPTQVVTEGSGEMSSSIDPPHFQQARAELAALEGDGTSEAAIVSARKLIEMMSPLNLDLTVRAAPGGGVRLDWVSGGVPVNVVAAANGSLAWFVASED